MSLAIDTLRTPEHVCTFNQPVAFFYTGYEVAWLVVNCDYRMDDACLCGKIKVFKGDALQVG